MRRLVYGLSTMLMILGLTAWTQPTQAQDDPDKSKKLEMLKALEGESETGKQLRK